MGSVDTTRREVDRHEQKSEPHHTRYTDTEARAATDGQIDADTVDGQHAGDLGNHIEAKLTPGNNHEESVSWTSAFASVPIITTSTYDTSVTFGTMAMVTSRSTTGGTVYSSAYDNNTSDMPKMVHATEES